MKVYRRPTTLQRAIGLLAFAMLACASGTALAKERAPGCCPALPHFCCPDDYQPKPWPCLPRPTTCGYCDDYCRKPLPGLPCPNGCYCPDNYCAKPFPSAPCCPPSRWLKCPLPCPGPAVP